MNLDGGKKSGTVARHRCGDHNDAIDEMWIYSTHQRNTYNLLKRYRNIFR